MPDNIPTKKALYAKFDWSDYRDDGDQSVTEPVADLNEAIRRAVRKHADYFTLQEEETVEVGGKTFTGEKKDLPGKYYFTDESQVFTPEQAGKKSAAAQKKLQGHPAIRELKKNFARYGMSEAEKDRLLQEMGQVDDRYAREQADTRYVFVTFAGFVKLEEGDVVYDRNARQLWPQSSAASPAVKPPSLGG